MARYRIYVGQVVVDVDSDLTSVDAVKAAVEAGAIPEAGYFAPHTSPVHDVVLLSGGEDNSNAGQADAATEVASASASVLREGGAGSEVGAGESVQDSQHGEGLDPQAGAPGA